MNRLSLKSRRPRGCALQRHSPGQIKIDQLSARRTDRMIVPVGFAVVPARALAKGSNFANQARIFQIPERVINRGEADAGHLPAGPFKNFHGRRMLIGRAHQFQHHAALPGQTHSPLRFDC